jgi:hypothetical protein
MFSVSFYNDRLRPPRLAAVLAFEKCRARQLKPIKIINVEVNKKCSKEFRRPDIS